MANKECNLPVGSDQHQSKGYVEVHVPALEPRPLAPDEMLVKIADMPDWAHQAFKGMQQLNRVESRVYETAIFKADNILLCAPTGAGKTNVAVLTILQQIALNRNPDGSFNHRNYKIVYVAPTKALVAEIVGNLSNRLGEYGVNVKELSGDKTLTRQHIEDIQIIVTTPEDWDSITRKPGDRTYSQLVKLLIIDEILLLLLLLHDNRGPALESIVARSIRQIETTKEQIRLVGLSATFPNLEDVAQFLHVDVKKGLFHFDNSYRPVPLSQQCIGITEKQPLQRFQLMNRICSEKVMSVAGKHQVLIFVHSREEAIATARAIRDLALTNNTLGRFLKEESRHILQRDTEKVKSNDLKDLLSYGFAVHHDGMSRVDCQHVEGLFASGHVQVLVSTMTGVNLPAHTVIIKGTQIYNPEKGAWTELSPLDVMQMLGCAGRPQIDSSGEGIIITGHSELQYYLSLMNQQLPVESQFISKLADQLNAEIALGAVHSAREACNWLRYTYLYVRMRENPTHYGLAPDSTLEESTSDLIHRAAALLDEINLIKYDRESGYFQVTDLGRIASYYYITHGTISTYNKHLKPMMRYVDLCWLFSLSEEFKYVTVKEDEKKELAGLEARVPILIEGSLEKPSAKINVLLQTYITQVKLKGPSLTSDMEFITQRAGRLMRAIFEIVLKKGWPQVAEQALNMCKMVNKRMWFLQTPLRQFHGIPNEIFEKLDKKHLSMGNYYDLSPQEIGKLIHSPNLGRPLYKFIRQIPKLKLAAHVQPITRTNLRVELTIKPDFQWEENVHGYMEPFWVTVEDNYGKNILHHEFFMLKKQYIKEDHTLSFVLPISEPLPPQYKIHVTSDQWLGSQSVFPVSLSGLMLPEKFSPPTELLDLQLLPVSALENHLYEALYPHFQHFNRIETQVFHALYNTDDNVLVAAPVGDRKTVCAELAILRNHQKGPDSVLRVVYIAPLEAIANERYRDWNERLGQGLGIRVVQLTGQSISDLTLLEKGNIIISTPENWDVLSRGWKVRAYVQQVSLFIVDDFHLIGGRGGPVLEVIVSRMRYIASQIRIVALSYSLSNAKDLGEWIGAPSHRLFNFTPDARPVPLEIHVQGVDVADFKARMQVMTKPAYNAIVQNAKDGKPAIVFVPMIEHVRPTAMDLLTYASIDGGDRRVFVLSSHEGLELLVDKIQDDMLRDSLLSGVGWLHEGLSSSDQQLVSQLFRAGLIQVCVMSSSMCWGVPLSAHLVVVMGTQYHDGHQCARTYYPVTDVLQMMDHAGRPLVDNSGKCVILCHAPRKDYYQKFLYEALPIESHLHHFLHDHLNAEIAGCDVKGMQDANDYIKRTFMYKRLTQNPSYYHLQGVTDKHLDDYLLDLAVNTVKGLLASKCVSFEDGIGLYRSNLGEIASDFYINYATIKRFSSSLTPEANELDLLKILVSASEYADLPVRPGEEEELQKLINHQRFPFENQKLTDPHVKANVLLRAHFSRQSISGTLALDQRGVILQANRLVLAMVHVSASNGWLKPSLCAMKLSKMLTQAMWSSDNELLQLPHFTDEIVWRCYRHPWGRGELGSSFLQRTDSIKIMFGLLRMEDGERRQLLQMTDPQLEDLERYLHRFPEIDFSVDTDDDQIENGIIVLVVTLYQDLNGRTELEPIVEASRYPQPKEEGWWLILSDYRNDQVLAMKRYVCTRRPCSFKLRLALPSDENYLTRFDLRIENDSYFGYSFLRFSAFLKD